LKGAERHEIEIGGYRRSSSMGQFVGGFAADSNVGWAIDSALGNVKSIRLGGRREFGENRGGKLNFKAE
jgi:hypothetical protein